MKMYVRSLCLMGYASIDRLLQRPIGVTIMRETTASTASQSLELRLTPRRNWGGRGTLGYASDVRSRTYMHTDFCCSGAILSLSKCCPAESMFALPEAIPRVPKTKQRTFPERLSGLVTSSISPACAYCANENASETSQRTPDSVLLPARGCWDNARTIGEKEH